MEIALTKKNIYSDKKMYLIAAVVTVIVVLLMVIRQSSVYDILNVAFLSVTISMTMYFDLKMRIVPNEIILVALGLRLLMLVIIMMTNIQGFSYIFIDSLVGGAFLLLILMVARLINKGLGAGDIKLFLAIGLYVGFNGAFNILFYTILVSFVFAILALLTKKMSMKDSLPMVPFVLVGFMATMLLGGI